MRTGLYARVSTDRQSEKYGIASQVEAMKTRCGEKEWEIVPDGDREAFIDDGYSGSELDRPALSRLRDLARRGLVELVLAHDPDRLSRKLSHQMLLAEEMGRLGVRLEFITQEMGDTPEHRMFFNMRGVFAEYEREKIRERTVRGIREKARQGKVVNPRAVPFGYAYNNGSQTFVRDHEKAEVVNFIFHAFVQEGLSLGTLAATLNRLGVKSPGRGRWRVSTLGRLLRNEVYTGTLHQLRYRKTEPEKRKTSPVGTKTGRVLRPREEWASLSVEPLVSTELFQAVQTRLEKNRERARRNTRHEYLLAGILFCGYCGGRMGGHRGRGVAYYRCYRQRADNMIPCPEGGIAPCRCPEVRAEAVEPVVWQTIASLVRDPEFLVSELRRRNEGSSQTRQVLEKELGMCMERLGALPGEQHRLVEGYRKNLYPDFMVREEMARMQQEQAGLDKRKVELEKRLSLLTMGQNQEEQVRAMVSRIGKGLDTMGFTQQQELLRLLVEKVYYKGTELEISTIIPLEGEKYQLYPAPREGARG
ncbi:MAG: recombinase family protein [Dehalococcoidia bacterium]